MSLRIPSAFTASALLLGLSLLPSTAHAKALDRCGGVFLSASSSCEFKPIQECMTTCAVTSVEQVCAQKTFSMCNASCTLSDVTTCTQTRSDACTKQCETISTKSSHEVCTTECTDNCTAHAVSKGKFGGDTNRCHNSCLHDCNVRCDTCSTTDQSTDCTTKCMSVVQNECTEEVTRDCVLTCQTDNYTTCQTETVNTCNTTCQNKGGALFCDGQFIEASDLQACADQLAAEFSFNIDVNVHVAVNGNGSVTTTNDDGTKTTAKCSFGPPTGSAGSGMALGALAMLGVAVTRRRRRA
jgi:MYXO-CTERM domain-containing protein